MSQPAFDPARRQVWYTDASSGFYDLQLSKSVWPDPTSIPSVARRPAHKHHKRKRHHERKRHHKRAKR
jgi:hypothetical protein